MRRFALRWFARRCARVWVLVWTLLILGNAVGPERAATAQPAGEPTEVAKTAYERHMDNGVKLYREGNCAAAGAEFQAAYAAEPKASPLINLALCHKKQADYAAAIEALELALRKHSDTMKPEHRAAAEKEVRELKALLAHVRVTLQPAGARFYIDGKAQPAGTAAERLALAPGEHTFRAEAEGHAVAEQTVTLIAGDNPRITLALSANVGELVVEAYASAAKIEVNGEPVGSGRWTGQRPPGLYRVRVSGGESSVALLVRLARGGRVAVTQTEDGELSSDAAVPDDADPEIEPTGIYLSVGAGLVAPTGSPTDFVVDTNARAGFEVGGGGGYRVADWIGFEVAGQYSDVKANGTFRALDAVGAEVPIQGAFQLRTLRGVALARVMLPGHTPVRFVGRLGVGVLFEQLTYSWEGDIAPESEGVHYLDTDFEPFPFGQLDTGIEIEVSQVLIDVFFHSTIQSTRQFGDGDAFKGKPQLFLGPVIRVGYGFW